MRAFIGIDFSEELKKQIFDIQQRVKRHSNRGRWENVDNLHITLKFLGEITSIEKEMVDSEMNKICLNRRPFKIGIKDFGAFTRNGNIGVLWLGLGGDIQELKFLNNEIETALFNKGFQKENRSYNPHITIARDVVFDCEFEAVKASIGELQLSQNSVERLSLFKSELINNKRVYSKVSNYNF